MGEGHTGEPSDQSQLVQSLQDQTRYPREQLDAESEARTEECRRHDTTLAQLTSRISAIEPPQKPSDDAETAEKQQGRDRPHSDAPGAQAGTLRPAAIWIRFLAGLLLVGLAAAFAAYMYEDPAFGPLVRALPVSSLVAEAFGGYAGYTAGRGLGFRWFFLGGAIVGLVAMAVSHCASVMVNGPPARWGRSFFAMGLVWVSTWAMFTGGANIGKIILLRSRRGEQAEVLKILVSLAAAIAPVLVGIIALLARD